MVGNLNSIQINLIQFNSILPLLKKRQNHLDKIYAAVQYKPRVNMTNDINTEKCNRISCGLGGCMVQISQGLWVTALDIQKQ